MVSIDSNKGQRLGYVRVSTSDQNPGRQLETLELDRTFTDYASGSNTNRPALQDMLQYAREGDTIFAHSIDRLARSLVDLQALISNWTAKGISVHFLTESLTFTGDDTPLSQFLLAVMGSFAEFERKISKERQREGIARAKREGKYKGGRKRALDREKLGLMADRLAAGVSRAQVAREFGVSASTIYRREKELGAVNTTTYRQESKVAQNS